MIFVEQTESRRVRRQSCNSDQVRKERESVKSKFCVE